MKQSIRVVGTANKTHLQDILVQLSAHVPDCDVFKSQLFPTASPDLFQIMAEFETDRETASEIMDVLDTADFEEMESHLSVVRY